MMILAVELVAQDHYGHNKQLQKQIADNFFGEDGDLDRIKLKAYRDGIEKRRDEVFYAIIRKEEIKKGKSKKKARKKAKKDDDIKNYDLLIKFIDSALRLDGYELHDTLRKALELDEALKVTGKDPDLVFKAIKQLLKKKTISKKGVSDQGEASNLYDPAIDKILTQEELELRKSGGEDISLLDPIPNEEVWVKRDIENIKLHKNFHNDLKLYKGVKLPFPTSEALFQKVRKTQTKPKLHVLIDGPKGKEEYKFKFKVGAEIYSEITAGALASMLGFHIDASKYIRDFKVILPAGMTIKDFNIEWYSYFKDYRIEDYVIDQGIDDNGHYYLVFKEGLLEAKPKEFNRVGPWAYGDQGHQGLREVRAMYLFNTWIANNDQKERDNNKLILRENDEGKQEFYFLQHDLGFSFGRFMREKPNEFPWSAIKEHGPDFVKLNLNVFQPNSGFKHVTYADARWMIRKIARLSREQITQAVSLGGWPQEVEMLLIEKLISRRNSFIRAFDLEDEFAQMDVDRQITSKNGKLLNGQLMKSEFDGASIGFKSEVAEVLSPIYEGFELGVAEAIQSAAGSIDTIVINAETLGYDGDFIAEVQLSLDRDIDVNPEPTGLNDNFLVMDTFKVSFALGVGAIVRGKVSYVKEYKIVYPVNTENEGLNQRRFALNALLPIDIKRGNMPEKYVLILEDYFEGEGEILLKASDLPVSYGISKSLGRLTRSVISKSENKYQVSRDISPYKGTLQRLYADLLIFRIPLWEHNHTEGVLARNTYEVQFDRKNVQAANDALAHLVRYGDITQVDQMAVKGQIQTGYQADLGEMKYYFYENYNRKRVDHVIETIFDDNGNVSEKEMFQVDAEQVSSWQFIGDGETKDKRVKLIGHRVDENTIADPYMEIKLKIKDKNTTNGELVGGYLPMIDRIAQKNNFLNFTPSIHTDNNLWGHSYVKIKLGIPQAALDTLLNTPPAEFYKRISAKTGKSVRYWKKKRTVKARNFSSNYNAFLRRKLQRFIHNLEKAKVMATGHDRYYYVHNAFDIAIWKDSHIFSAELLEVVLEVIGDKNYYMKATIDMPGDVEMRFPARTPLINEINKKVKQKQQFYEFDFKYADEIWDVFYLD